MVLTLVVMLFGCGQDVVPYRCSCTKSATNLSDGSDDIDEAFNEIVCDTDENIKNAFAAGGILRKELDSCEEQLKQFSDNAACDCTCTQLDSECP